MTSASLALYGMVANTAASTAMAAEPNLTLATTETSLGAQYARFPRDETKLTIAAKIALIRQKVKYVFVLFQENRSFDHYFGTYPGANGLTTTYTGADPNDPDAQPANVTASYLENIRNIDGSYGTITPFLAPRTITDVNGATVQLYPEDFYSVDHSHAGYINDLHADGATRSMPKNDGYALDQEGLHYSTDASTTSTIVNSSGVPPTTNPSLATKQKGEVVMAHVDCDTIPFLWKYADIGTLFDNLHQTVIGPSTPNAIALIAAQSGATQWALHPGTTGNNTTPLTVPNETDSAPFAGSTSDTWAGKPPYGPDEEAFAVCTVSNGANAGTYNNLSCPVPGTSDPAYGSYTDAAVVPLKGAVSSAYGPQLTLTSASLPLSFMGNQINAITSQDQHPVLDLADVQNDIHTIFKKDQPVSWGWYQQGFGPEPFDGQDVVDTVPANTPHSSYIVHHNGPQYFGYLGDNAAELANMHGLSQFYSDVSNHALPASGGVFYVRGGYYNNDALLTSDPSPAVRTTFEGNDDHGTYSDSQISEASVADSVNAIVNSPYWPQSAIIITYDESDGFYDHAPELIRSWGPDGQPLSGGPRIPTIVLSPYSAAHTVSHVYGDHGSIVRFINLLFDLVPLSNLPNERAGLAAAAANPAFNSPSGAPQTAVGPDDNTSVGTMLEAFDNDRLLGNVAVVPASAFTLTSAQVQTLPHFGGNGCSTLSIVPTDYTSGFGAGKEIDPPPSDFDPRPTVSPGNPYLEETILGVNTTSPWTP
jgi:phospholipase C